MVCLIFLFSLLQIKTQSLSPKFLTKSMFYTQPFLRELIEHKLHATPGWVRRKQTQDIRVSLVQAENWINFIQISKDR